MQRARALDQGLIGRYGTLSPNDGGRTHRYSLSGGFDSDLPMSTHQWRGGDMNAEIQGGGVNVRFKSVSGGMRLQSNGQAAPSAKISQRELLEKVERGELTAAQAAAQM